MPHVVVKLWPGKSEEQKQRLADRSTEDVMEVLGYGEESVSVARAMPAGTFNPMVFVFNRARYEASLTGGIRQTQQLVDHCAANGIHPETEIIAADQVNRAWEQVVDKEARYRYVIDASTI